MRKDNSDRIEKWAAISLTTALTLLLTLTLILCGPAAVAQSATFHANGAFASASDCSVSQTPLVCITISVSRGSTAAGQTATFLSYDFRTLDSTGNFQETLGFGQIPNSAFQVHGQTDSLNVDTSKIVNFDNQFCTFDPNTGIETCNPFSGGVVTGTWTAIPSLMTSQFSGTSKATFPDVIFIFTGTEESQTALANVSGFGVALANMTGSVGTNHQTSITVQVLH